MKERYTRHLNELDTVPDSLAQFESYAPMIQYK